MAKIWIVRERMLWADNPFPYENTTAYTTKKMAMKYMRWPMERFSPSIK